VRRDDEGRPARWRWRRRLRAIPVRTLLLPRGEAPPRAIVVRLILAFALAAVLWVRVSADSNPVRTLVYGAVSINARTANHYSLLTRLPTGTIHVDALQSQLRDTGTPGLYVDLTHVSSTAPFTAPVHVSDAPPGALVSYAPHEVRVQLQTQARKSLPLRYIPIASGGPPQGFNPPQFTFSPTTVTVSGPSQVVASVSTVRVPDLNEAPYTQNTTLTRTPQLFDNLGHSIAPGVVHISPPTVTVMVRVNPKPYQQLVTVTPDITGRTAPGYGITNIIFFPQFVHAESNSSLVTLTLTTEPITITGLTTAHPISFTIKAPPGVTLDRTQGIITIDIAPLSGKATATVKARVVNKRTGTTVALGPPTVTVAYGGPLPNLHGAALPVVTLDVGNRPPGVYHLTPTVALPSGLTVQSLAPPSLRVTITAPATPKR